MTDGGAGRPPGAGREPWQQAVITDIRRLTSRVVSVTLRPERWRPFLPGQHIDVRLTADDGYQAHRAYSIASAPASEGTLELVIERLEDGEVSPFFHEVSAPGDRLDIRGPFAAHFVWRPDSAGPTLLVAGGSGIAPFLSMVRERAHVTAPPRVLLLYSARTWDDLILREELMAHERRQRGFTVVFCLTRDAARRPGDFARRIDRGIVDDVLARLGDAPQQVFACGGNRFVGAVADLLIAAGVPAARILTERYGGA